MTRPKTAWQPGVSGNPRGRPRGSGKVAQLRESIAGHVPDILEALIAQAKAGDVGAARLLIERVIPPLKAAEQPAPLTLPAGSLTDQGRALLQAAAVGQLAPGQAAQMLAGLGALARLVETDELAARVAALEARREADP